jgi:triphosphatase
VSKPPTAPPVAVTDDGELEVEVKLTAPWSVLEATFRELAAARPAGPAVRLESVYFDTPDRRLEQRGLTLRVRSRNGSFTQTVKADAKALTRPEIETALVDGEPDLSVLRRDPLRAAVGSLFPEEISPCFMTAVERRIVVLARGAGLGRAGPVAVALDRGELRVPGRAPEPIAELEIEGRGGDRQAVLATAGDLVRKGAARLVVRSKAARGHDLAAERPPRGTKAAKARLERAMPLGQALSPVFAGCLAQWWANHDAAFDGRDPEGVHQLRVAIRRLRSALTLFGGYLAPARLAWLKAEARAVMADLGPARDLDVLTDELLPAVAAARPNDAALGAVRAAAADARALAYERVRAQLSSERYTLFLLELAAWIDRRGWLAEADHAGLAALDNPIGPVADALLAKRAKVVRKRGRHFRRLEAPARHEVRLALKKLRYALDFTRSLYPEACVKPYLKRLARLQDAFGHSNDLAQAEALLDRLVVGEPGRLAEGRGLVLGWYAHVALDAEHRLVAGWQAFRKAPLFWQERSAC